MIIVIAVLIAVVMLVIFTLALFRMAGRRSAWEQMLEDEDQRKYLESWVRKQESVNVNKAPGCDIGHNAETVKKISEKANRAWTFRENRALWNMRRREPAQRKSARRQKGDQHGLQDSGG